MRTVVVVWIGVLALASSCSVLFMDRVPDRWTPATEPRCSTTSGWIAWDLLVVAASGASMVLGASAKVYGTGEYVVLSANAVVHALSAHSGSGRRSRCEAARNERDAYLQRPATVPVAAPVAVDAGAPADAVKSAKPIEDAPFVVDPEEPPR